MVVGNGNPVRTGEMGTMQPCLGYNLTLYHFKLLFKPFDTFILLS